jgi:hypothetical protein
MDSVTVIVTIVTNAIMTNNKKISTTLQNLSCTDCLFMQAHKYTHTRARARYFFTSMIDTVMVTAILAATHGDCYCQGQGHGHSQMRVRLHLC